MRSRQKIVDATLGLIGSAGFEGVNVAAVAHAAGVSRQTVYSIFGSREELVSQAVAGIAVEVLGGIRSQSESAQTPFDFVVALFVAGRRAVRTDPVLTTLLLAEQGNPVFDTGMIARAKPIARELISPVLDLDPTIEPRLDDLIDIVVRLGLSVIMFDDDAIHDDDDLREFLARWLLPGMSALS